MKRLVLFICLILMGCKTKEYVYIPQIETEYVTKNLFDSIYIYDSIYVLEKNDTVYLTKYSTKSKVVYKNDTIIKKDSVPYLVKIEIVKEVNVIYWWLKCLIWWGALTLFLLFFKFKKVI